MKLGSLRKWIGVWTLALFIATFFVGISLVYAQNPPKDWTEDQLKDFLAKPYTPEQKAEMGSTEIEKIVPPLVYHKGLSDKELFKNGMHYFMPVMLQYGIGISSKDFHKIWIEQEGYKNPKIFLVDVRQEGEYTAGHIPGAIRVDLGSFYWLASHLLPDPDADYYLYCKSGYTPDGSVRGAMAKKIMLEMGYSGKITVITDGFRGWMENGYPVENMHGLFTFVKGTFQQTNKYNKK